MSFNTFYREQLVERMYDDGTYEEQLEESYDFIWSDKIYRDDVQDRIIETMANEYDLRFLRKATDQQKLDFIEDIVKRVTESYEDVADEMANDAIHVLAEESE